MAQRESEQFPLHKCVFQGDVKLLNSLIRTRDIAEKDKQGALSYCIYIYIYICVACVFHLRFELKCKPKHIAL